MTGVTASLTSGDDARLGAGDGTTDANAGSQRALSGRIRETSW
jgi:hypothetical protein